MTPSHQFRFGMTLSIAKRLRLLQWAKEHDAYVIENDYDGEFRYGSRQIPSLQSLDEHDRVVYAGTFSKILMPSFRLSYVVLPPKLMEAFRERHMRRMKRLYRRGASMMRCWTLSLPRSGTTSMLSGRAQDCTSCCASQRDGGNGVGV